MTTRRSFNPRAREGRDATRTHGRSHATSFQSTRPRGARRARAAEHAQQRVVSIHAPARGATAHAARLDRACAGFNPRAREGRDASSPDSSPGRMRFQSTRPRGARHYGSENMSGKITFQSTRPRGARRCVPSSVSARSVFQSTRPRGARQDAGFERDAVAVVSIHAPARGATCGAATGQPATPCFNPRAREGRDPRRWPRVNRPTCFNPRAREGRDKHGDENVPAADLFQSTRPRGARHLYRRRHWASSIVSIHAPARGATSVFGPCRV